MFYDVFTALCDSKKVSKSKVLEEISVSTGNLPKWRKGGTPKAEILNKIADYFNITVDELLGNEKSLTDEDKEIKEYLEFLKYRPEGKMLFSVAKGCTKEEIEQAVKIIDAIRKTDDD